MLRRAPHILITTPESLNIMLTTERGRGMFTFVRAVIVDEIHAVAGSKRGAHLALTLERLDALCDVPPQRIGLSATQRPLDEVARYLGGCDRSREGETPEFRSVKVVDCGLLKRMELTVASPVADLAHVEARRRRWRHPPAAEARTTLNVNRPAQAEDRSAGEPAGRD
jgi:ATP-dependent Lhr-like helicase